MAGVSDLPFRQLCRRLGADYAVAEMVTSDARLWHTDKTRTRLAFDGEATPRVIQIAGSEPRAMADAARRASDLGADIVDINMGCPAKKVCNRAAGSALLRDETLVRDILRTVCAAVDVPVTLKTRTGWSPAARNGVTVARLAEDAGIRALTVHGRTRECGYRGQAEYDTIAAIKQAVGIPVIANGDIASPAQAARVLAHTGADGLMIGRAAHGNPWIFAALAAARDGREYRAPSFAERVAVMRAHVTALQELYGDVAGTRIARKHVGWYLEAAGGAAQLKSDFNRIETASAQLAWLDGLAVNPAWEQAA
ncbi:MAG: tRNA dihydrouridine synthase DusB [Gammaproteobacteria bacterium]|nr:tRNA dihydrouridine synthase DusB [Gammaproteobacteria bacterium]